MRKGKKNRPWVTTEKGVGQVSKKAGHEGGGKGKKAYKSVYEGGNAGGVIFVNHSHTTPKDIKGGVTGRDGAGYILTISQLTARDGGGKGEKDKREVSGGGVALLTRDSELGVTGKMTSC